MTRRVAPVVLLSLAALGAAGVSFAAFGGTTANSGNSFAARSDWLAPSAGSSVIIRQNGGVAGYVKQSGSYYVYANVSDRGNPASGTTSVSANASSITTGANAAALTSGSYSAAGQTYNWRSALLTANGTLSTGTYNYSLTLADSAANSRTQTGFSVVVDNTAPTASDIQATNGGTVNKPDSGDTVVYTFSEQIDPSTIKAGWDGSSTTITATVQQATPRDRLATSVNLGTIDLRSNAWVTADAAFNATLVMSGSTVTVTLGSPTSGSIATVAAANALQWTPTNTATDRAGNACSTTTATESGVNDADF